jgi:hypothetical protein
MGGVGAKPSSPFEGLAARSANAATTDSLEGITGITFHHRWEA